jgi:hypothetical protein
MCSATKFYVKCGDNEVTDFVEQSRGVRQRCSLRSCLFNNYIYMILLINISKDNVHASTIGKVSIAEMLLADDFN